MQDSRGQFAAHQGILPLILDYCRWWKGWGIVWLEATGDFAPGIECIVMEVNDGRITKMKAAIPDERLLKLGFI
jgi:hypothetical protein